MKGILVIVVLLVVGLGAGLGAGMMLAPEPEIKSADCAEGAECPEAPEKAEAAEAPSEPAPEPENAPFDYVKLNNQFVIPVVREDRVSALVVVSITLEVAAGSNTAVFDREPKIRDAFLQEMFDFAYLGGFDGPFTKSENLIALRQALREIGQRIVGPEVNDVLIVDLVRQEV